MCYKKNTIAVFSSFICCFFAFSLRSSAQQVTRNDDWTFTTSYGVPVWIAYNEVKQADRAILVFIEAPHFTAENIRKLFTSLAQKYKEPKWLDITAFSDKKMLQRAINTKTSGFFIDWADTPEGRAAAKKWSEDHDPLPSGYYRAYYSRMERKYYSRSYIEEYYSYSPDPAKTDLVRVTLQKKPELSPYSGNLNSDLLIAAREGDESKARSLLKQGANVNARDKNGDTALMLAALTSEDLATVKTLLAGGAEVDAKDKEGDTALIYAASNHHKADILEALLDKGANINHQNDAGYTALIMAAVSDYRFANLKALLTRGANLEARNKYGETALLKANDADNNIDMVKALLDKGANISVTDKDGNTPLMKAAQYGRLEFVKLLLEKGADIAVKNNAGITPLMKAQSKDIAILLLDKGADVNVKDKEGKTALVHATRWGTIDKVQLLLDRGADINAKDNNGQTALSLASSGYGVNNQMLDLLEDAEARANKAVIDKPESPPPDNANVQLVIKRDPLAQCCEEVASVAFSPDGKMIASKIYHSSFAGKHGVVLWDALSGKLIRSIEGPPSGAYSISFFSSAKEIVSEYGRSWDITTGKLVRVEGYSKENSNEQGVSSTAFSNDEKFIVTSEKKIGERNKVIIRDAGTDKVIRSFTTDSPVTELLLATEGKTLVGVFRETNTIVIWDVLTGKTIQKIQIPGPVFLSMTHSKNTKLLAASVGKIQERLPVLIFDVETAKLKYDLGDHSIDVFALVFSPDDKLLATGSSDTTIKLWDMTNGKLLRTLHGHTQLVRSVAFSPDGRLLVSGGGKNETKIWSLNSGELLVTLQTFNDGNWIAYTPDGYYNCSEGASKYLAWRVGKKMVDAAIYNPKFFKPEIIADRLQQ